MQQQWAISQLDCDMRWKVDYIPRPVMTSSVAGKRRNSKALLKAKPIPKKVMVTVWRSAAHLIHYSFRNPCETITYEKYAQLMDEMHWKRHHPQPALVTRKGPVHLHDMLGHTLNNQHFRSRTIWATEFCLICRIHLTSRQPPITSSSISTTFCRENASTTSRKQKMLSNSSSNPKAWISVL